MRGRNSSWVRLIEEVLCQSNPGVISGTILNDSGHDLMRVGGVFPLHAAESLLRLAH